MNVHDKTHVIRSCWAADWENISAIFLGVKNTYLIYKGRQLCTSPGTFEGHCKMFLKVFH